MKFTASNTWLIASRSPSRVIQWKVYIRKVSSLAYSLTDATHPWTDVTEYVREIPTISTTLEFQLGTSSSDSLSITLDNIAWWKANAFNLSAGEYLEVKVQELLGLDEDMMAADVNCEFSGIIDPATAKATETPDEYTVEMYSYDELGNRIAASTVNISAPNGDYGMYLLRTNIEITDTNLAGYPCLRGPHTLTYNYNDGTVLNMKGAWSSGTAYVVDDAVTYDGETYNCTADVTDTVTPDQDTSHWAKASEHAPSISFDGGIAVPLLPDATVTAGNGKYIDEDIQRVEVYGHTPFIDPSASINETFIMKASGDALPALMHNFTSARSLLTKFYAAIGITDIDFDTLEFASHDGTPRLSFLDRPPDDPASEDLVVQTLVDDGSSGLLIAVGTKVYRRNMTTAAYTEILDIGAAGDHINRIWRDSVNDHLWVGYGADSSDSITKIRVWDLGAGSWLTSETALIVSCLPSGADLMDYDYGAGTVYGLIMADGPSVLKIWEISGSSLVSSNLYEFTTVEIRQTRVQVDAGSVVYVTGDSSTLRMEEISLDGAGSWSAPVLIGAFADDDGRIKDGALAYDFTSSMICYWDSVQKYLFMFNGVANIIEQDVEDCGYLFYTGSVVEGLISREGKTRFITFDSSLAPEIVDSVTLIHLSRRGAPLCHIGGYSGAPYMLDYLGKLWQCSDTIAIGFSDIDYSAMTIHDAINQVLTAFLIFGKISPMKKAAVYRRIDDAGAVVTSGNSMTLDEYSVAEVVEGETLPACNLISITSRGETHTYDGTTFDVGQYSTDRVLSLSNDFIPPNVLKDLCYYLWNFIKNDHVPLALDVLTAESQYEIFDGGAVNLTLGKIQKNATGLITGKSVSQDGSMKVTVTF